MVRNNILNLRIREQFLFTDEEMNPRQTADREEVLNVFTPLAHSIVSKILEAGDCYLEIAERYPIARQESTFTSSFLHGLIIENGVLRSRDDEHLRIGFRIDEGVEIHFLHRAVHEDLLGDAARR